MADKKAPFKVDLVPYADVNPEDNTGNATEYNLGATSQRWSTIYAYVTRSPRIVSGANVEGNKTAGKIVIYGGEDGKSGSLTVNGKVIVNSYGTSVPTEAGTTGQLFFLIEDSNNSEES